MKAHSSDMAELGLATVRDVFLAEEDVRTGTMAFLDPAQADEPDDPVSLLTHRQLLRLMFIAAETGVRFEREQLAADPVNWLLTPKALFGGQAAVDACRRHEGFLHAIILHGLSLGLDADPDEIAWLLADEDDDEILPELQGSTPVTMPELAAI